MLRRFFRGLLLTSLALLVSGIHVFQPFVHTNVAVAAARNAPSYLPLVTTTAAVQGQPALLASYVMQPSPSYQDARYTPRSFAVAPYAGWDVLTLPGGINTTRSNNDWLTLRLNRPATLAIVWRGQLDPPAWMSSWSRSEHATINGKRYPTYRQTFPAGTVVLGGVNNSGVSTSQPTYLVLFAEENGNPSPAPIVPSGQEAPQANKPCPAWVHDQYVAVAPDGQSYPTWHPQIDPVYWCYFGHEHGSDPALFSADYKPVYGYTAAQQGKSEPHTGFKSYVFDDELGQRWLITHHFGTAGLMRACERFHSMDVAVADKATGELLADFHLMGDFGKSVVNKTGEILAPSACPDQAAIADAAGSRGIRRLPVANRDGVGYEPWRLDSSGNILGFNSAALTFNTPSAMVMCNDVICDQPISTGGNGAFRFISFLTGFGVATGTNAGVFYTDGYGKQLMSAEQAGAVRQYVKPGTNISMAGCSQFVPSEPWRMLYICTKAPVSTNVSLEGALQSPN